MRLPRELQEAIEELAATAERGAILRAGRELSERYQRGECAVALPSAAHRVAYLETRMPATFAANRRVFAEVRRLLPDITLESMLDSGAGPGTAMWAAAAEFSSLRRFRLIERDPALIELGRKLATHSTDERFSGAEWVQGDAATCLSPRAPREQFDLLVISYALGEFHEPLALVTAAWNVTAKVMVIIEPGTPRHFQTVLAARDWLIAAGDEFVQMRHTTADSSPQPGATPTAQIVAPCPHHNLCPLAAAGDWCHFAERLERTAEHRRIKGGTLGFEDEKFSYLVASRIPAAWPQARIVRHPRFYPGHVKLTLCTPEGLKEQAVGKSSKEKYRAARKAKWGDAWEIR